MACNGAHAFAEYSIAKANLCTPVAAASAEACALVLSGVTACVALEVRRRVQKGCIATFVFLLGVGARWIPPTLLMPRTL